MEAKSYGFNLKAFDAVLCQFQSSIFILKRLWKHYHKCVDVFLSSVRNADLGGINSMQRELTKLSLTTMTFYLRFYMRSPILQGIWKCQKNVFFSHFQKTIATRVGCVQHGPRRKRPCSRRGSISAAEDDPRPSMLQLNTEVMVMVHCFIWLSQQAEAP